MHHHCKKWPYHLDPDVTDLPPKPPKAPLALTTFATAGGLPTTPDDPLESGGMNVFHRTAFLYSEISTAMDGAQKKKKGGRGKKMTQVVNAPGARVAPAGKVLKLELPIEPVELAVIDQLAGVRPPHVKLSVPDPIGS